MIIEKAIEMSKLIGNSDELKKYTSAKKALADQPELKEEFDYYLKFLDSMDSAEMSFEDLESNQREEIEKSEKFFSENTLIRDYLASEASLKQMLQIINTIVNQVINS